MDSDMYYLVLEGWMHLRTKDSFKEYLRSRREKAVSETSEEEVSRKEHEILGDTYEDFMQFLGE